MNSKKLGLLAASAASLLASAAFAGEPKTTTGKDGKTYICQNAQCKGKSECAGNGNAGCGGQNSCKGKGWVTAASKEECEAGGKGKWKEFKAAAADTHGKKHPH